MACSTTSAFNTCSRRTTRSRLGISAPAAFTRKQTLKNAERYTTPELRDFESRVTGAEARELSWLATMTEIIRTNPGIRLTLWCYEDAALIWPEVLRALSGYRGPALLDGDNDMLAMLLTEEGYRSLARSLLARPPRSVAERRDRIGTALEADAKPDVLALDISLPGWGGDDVRVISERYEEDCAEIARLPGVTFIAASLATIAATALVSWPLYAFIEQPGQDFGRRYIQRLRARQAADAHPRTA